MSFKWLEDKVAVVTGAASGIGRATAEQFAREGARVVLADIEEEGLEDVAQSIRSIGGEARGYRCDVSQEAEVASLMAFARDAYGGLDTL